MTAPTYTYKIILCGDGAVGKTSLIKRYSEYTFRENYLPTIGSNFATKRIQINGVQITSQYWDMGGQPQFKIVRQNFYRGARGIIYVFDVSRRETFENLEKWREEVNEILTAPSCIVIGNKIDLPRMVEEEEARQYALSVNAYYFETSVLENINVQESMDKINEIIFEKQASLRAPISSQKVSSYSKDLIQTKIQCPATPRPSKTLFPEYHFPKFHES